MFLIVEITADKEGAWKVEDALYELAPRGWETVESQGVVTFKVYLKEGDPEIENIEKFLAKHPDLEVSYKGLKEENWAEIWKTNFRPLKVGKSLVILPPWESYQPAASEITIIVEPAQAFGTGHHPTTQMMLEAIEEYFKDNPIPSKVLDLGCGTGILGITCLKLSPNSQVWAIDIDEEALKACKKNAKLNDVEDRIFVSSEFPKVSFDLILANIGFRELERLSKKIKDLSIPEKTDVFLSGVLQEDLDALEKVYLNLGFTPIKKRALKEWGFLWMRA